MAAQDNPNIPYGFCHCGCGQKTAIPTKTSRNIGRVRGVPMRFIQGHYHGSNRKHGYCRTSTYNIWEQMKQRCLNPNNGAYPDYGGRGITVCDRWMTFDNFLSDMGERPGNLTLDRRENNGNYEPGNCRWATMKEQSNNRIKTRKFLWKGKIHTLREIADDIGAPYKFLHRRIAFHKVFIEEVVLADESNSGHIDGF